MYDFNNNNYPDIITQTDNTVNGAINIIYDYSTVNSYIDSLFLDLDNGGSGYIVHGDVDGNGWEDIIIASNSGRFWSITYNMAGQFQEPIIYHVEEPVVDIESYDLNNDGHDEVIFSLADYNIKCYDYLTDSIYVIDSTISGEFFLSDFNLDNYADIILKVNPPGIDSTIIIKYQNDGNFKFSRLNHLNLAYTIAPEGWVVVDFNNDSLPDIILTGSDYINQTGERFNRFYIYYNKGNFNLSNPNTILVSNYLNIGTGLRIDSDDLDGNGYNDIIIVRRIGPVIPNLVVLFNDGAGNFLDFPVEINQPEPSFFESNLSCYPNPFSEQIAISFQLEKTANIKLYISDVTGRIVNIIVNNSLNKGEYSFNWSGDKTDDLYYYQKLFIVTLEIDNQIKKTFKIIQI